MHKLLNHEQKNPKRNQDRPGHDRDVLPGHHGRDLCEDCSALMKDVEQRLEKCPHGAGKPACSKCEIHCYKPQMRARIREVMRFAGPRIILTHPILAFKHWQINK